MRYDLNMSGGEKIIERGIVGAIRHVALWFVLGSLAFLAFLYVWPPAKDSTDGAERSGMKLHTDALTGCQYLSAINGGITPRLNAYGKQIGCKP